MNRLLAVLWAVHLGLTAAGAAGPDDRYVELFSLIQEADRLAATGQPREAITRYLEAQAGLKQMQVSFPEWSPKVVAFRLSYVTSRLEPLTQKPATPAAPKLSPGEALTNQLRQLQEETTRLGNQNALLEAKLREALSVQPAASDPRELLKAEDRIAQLQKERDLLTVTLEQLRQQAATRPPAADAEREKQALEDLKKQFTAQAEAAETLRRQNDELQKQLAAAGRSKPAAGSPGNSELPALKETIAMLQASNRVLQSEQAAMEKRMLDWVRLHGAQGGARDKEWETQLAAARQEAEAARKERDVLVARLNDVTRELNQRPAKVGGAGNEELEKQLEALRARVQIFEAKAVPYSAEELALFKQPPPKQAADTNPPPVAAAGTPPAQKKRDELPPGAGPLIAAAERAIDAGRYDEAEKQFNTLLRQDENNLYILARLAGAQLDQDKVSEAETHLKRILSLDAENPAGLHMMGDLKYRQAKYDEAFTMLSQAAKLRPDRADTQYMLGRALIQQGNRQPAEAALRKSVQLKPGWGEPHYQLAVLYATQQPAYPELAQYHYKRAIAGGVPRNLEFEKFLEKRPAR